MARSGIRAIFACIVGLSSLPLACTRILTEQDCVRYRDRLKGWGEKKGKLDDKAVEDFMKTCAGATVSRSAARCMEQAGDENAFFKCLE